MPVYHILLVHLKPGVTQEQVDQWSTMGKQMVGNVPGLLEFHANAPLALTAHLAKGYDRGMVLVLESKEAIQPFAKHPMHQDVMKLREQLCDESLVFDLEF